LLLPLFTDFQHKEDEDIIHFLTSCPMLANVREEPFLNLKEEVIKNTARGTESSIPNMKSLN
jgi:hypothetical protein